MSKRLLVVILGPTASGKSTLALRTAQAVGGEIVNCDSVQLYRRLEVGTAKPGAEERRLVAHHLYDVIEPDEYYSAGRYMVEARKICREIAERGNIPVVVGGTGLYLRALLEGVFTGPGRSNEMRRRLEEIQRRKGPGYLHRLLLRKDPGAGSRIQPADRVRVVRALEVYFLTGTPISRLQRLEAAPGSLEAEPYSFHILKFGLNLPRQILYDRIHRRVDEMFRSGLVEEVRSLIEERFSPDSKGFEALGYRHVVAFLRGESSLDEAIELTRRDTRRYAKRQRSWFRREKNVRWIDSPGEAPDTLALVVAILRGAWLGIDQPPFC